MNRWTDRMITRRRFLTFLVTAPFARALPWEPIATALASIAPQTAATIKELTLVEIVGETLRKHGAEIALNITANNAFLQRMRKHS